MMNDTNDTNDTNGKTWARSEFGETFHSFSPSGTAICRKNIRWSSYASVHPEYLRTEAEVDQVVDTSLGYRKCVSCATKEQQHRDRVAASMEPVNPLDQVCEGILPETVAPKYDGQGGIDRDQQAEDLATASAEENAAAETETAETVDMDDLHTQALAEDAQRRIRAVAQRVTAVLADADLATSLHQAAQSLRELADTLAKYREPVRTEFADADDALEYLTQFTWEPTSENLTRDPDARVTVRRIYPHEGSIGTRQVMSVGYDITEKGNLRGRLLTSSSACYLDYFLIWYRPVQDTTI